MTSRLEGKRLDWWPFWITDGRRIGLPFEDCSEAYAFGLSVENAKTEQDYSEEDGGVQ